MHAKPLLSLVVAVAALTVPAVDAVASTIRSTILFTATDFTTESGVPRPDVGTLTGSFSVTFDPDVDVYSFSRGVELHGFSVPIPVIDGYAPPPTFIFTKFFGMTVLFSSVGSHLSIGLPTDVVVNSGGGSADGRGMLYWQNNGLVQSSNINYTVFVSEVPEISTSAGLSIGLAALGLTRLRRRRA